MKVLQPVAAIEYEDRYGDTYTIQIAKHPEGTWPWEVAWADDYNTFTLEQLRDHVAEIISEHTCPDEYHNEESDDYDHDEADCDNERNRDYVAAWRAIQQAAEQFEATGKITDNLSTVLRDTLSSTVNAYVRYPHARAVFNWDADRMTITNAVVRALEAQGVSRDEIDQFSYEANTSPDVLSVARQWVTTS